MRNSSDKSSRENQKVHFMYSNVFTKITPFMRKCGQNAVEPDRPQTEMWHMLIAS
jgi:hypothetical protein